jgi:CRP-like cAMP-binding protein
VNPKKLLKDLERALKQDPENLVLRLKVAAALREVGRRDDAVTMYRSVAVAYHKQGRLAQAIAVCRSVLEIEPSQRETQALLAELDAARQNRGDPSPFQTPNPADLAAPTGARPRRGTQPPPRQQTPQSIPALQRLQPIHQAPGKTLEPPPLPPASASGITPLPLPSIGQITPLPEDDFPSAPRLPLKAQPSGPMPAQLVSPPAATPAPPGPNAPFGHGPPRTPPDSPAAPLGPGRPPPRTTSPLPGKPPQSTPPPERVPTTPVMTAPQRPRALAGSPERVPQRTLPPPMPKPPAAPVLRRPSDAGADRATPAPAGQRKKPISVSQMTPTPSTPLPPPRPHTPTPAEAGAPSRFPLPYVHIPGQDDDGNTLPTIRPKVKSTTDLRALTLRQPAPDTSPPTAGADEATRIADEPSDARLHAPAPAPDLDPEADHLLDEDNATRVADGEPDMSDVELRSTDDTGVSGVETGVAVEPEHLHDGPLLDDEGHEVGPGGSNPVRLPDDLAAFSRSNRLLDVSWPEVKTDDEARIEEDTDPGATPRAARMPVPPPPPAPAQVATRAPARPPGAPPVPAKAGPAPVRPRVTKPRVRPPGPVEAPLDDAATGKLERIDPADLVIGAADIVSVDNADVDEDTGVTHGHERVEHTDAAIDPRRASGPGARDDGDTGDEGDAEDSLELARAFDRSFAADLVELAPDGSSIDRTLPLFARLSREALAELERRMSFRRCASGDLILREGDPGDACYIIHSGSVRVLKRDPAGSSTDVIEIARMGAGAIFGEFALLADRRRHASVQALEACELYEIPRRLLRELSAEYADVGPALERFYRERLLSTLLATAPFFQPLPEEERAALMQRFVPRRVEAGAAIIREGESGGGLYLIVLGNVDITRRPEGTRRAILLATLGEGAYFGEMSLLSGGRASATVTAGGPVELAQLSPRDFYDIVSAYPVIWEELRREASRRELLNQNILAGDTRMV